MGGDPRGAGIGFNRTVAFVRANPDWPAGPLLRRRAEEALLSERKSPATVRAYFATAKPSSAPGKFALALALRADGLRGGRRRDGPRPLAHRELRAEPGSQGARRLPRHCSPGSTTATGWSGRS